MKTLIQLCNNNNEIMNYKSSFLIRSESHCLLNKVLLYAKFKFESPICQTIKIELLLIRFIDLNGFVLKSKPKKFFGFIMNIASVANIFVFFILD